MIYLTLPNFYENFRLNNFLINAVRSHSNWLKEKSTIIQTSGQFSYCCWNGGINRNLGRGAFYNDIANCAAQNITPLRLNCANINLLEQDFDDSMGNIIIELNHNGSNLIEITNLELMDYITSRYPNYKFIFSKEADLITPFSIEVINTLLESKKFQLIGLPDRYTEDIDSLKQIKYRNQIELTINPICPRTCKSHQKCAIAEHNSQLIYSNISPILSCPKIKKIHQCKIKDLTDLKNIYTPLGITHFTFSPYYNSNELFTYYIHFFFKDEYIDQIYQEWNNFKGEK